MNNYTLINRPLVTSDESMFEAQRIDGIPTDMTFRQANELCSKARANGHDVVVFNTQAQ